MPLKWKLYYIASLYLPVWGILFFSWLLCLVFCFDMPLEMPELIFFAAITFTVATFVFKPLASPGIFPKSAFNKKLFARYFYMVLTSSILSILPFAFIIFTLFTYKRWETDFWIEAPMLLANICIFYISFIEWQALKPNPTHDDTSHSLISYTPGTPARPV